MDFITHIFLRSIWVAYAGLSYVYEDGIDFSQLNLPDMYTRAFNKNSYEDRVKSLEKICSGMFSASFLFFMIILGLINVGIVISLIVLLILTFFPDFGFINEVANLVLLFTGMLFLVDLLTLGILRKIPYLRTVYYPFYRVGRVIMLAPLYEDIYYGFLSNNKKWKMGLISLLFFLAFNIAFVELRYPGTFSTSFELRVESDDDALLFSGHYEDRVKDSAIGRSVIPSDIIQGQVLRIFIPHLIENEANISFDSCLKQVSDSEISEDELKLKCLNDIYQIALNDSVTFSKGLYQYNPTFDVDGLVFWKDISHLPRGPH
ncbi:MAG: hypothetical protein RI564_03860, partial [Gracilimonas sp.]|nr:hypothetical protein [Gracilimonas sp.]